VTFNSRLCGGYNYDSTSIRRPFDCLPKVIEQRNPLDAVTPTYLYIYAAVLQPGTDRP